MTGWLNYLYDGKLRLEDEIRRAEAARGVKRGVTKEGKFDRVKYQREYMRRRRARERGSKDAGWTDLKDSGTQSSRRSPTRSSK